jgi:hypothetical protein
MIFSMPEGMVYCHRPVNTLSETPINYFCDFINSFLIRIFNVVEWAGSVVIAQYPVCHFFVKAVKTNHSFVLWPRSAGISDETSSFAFTLGETNPRSSDLSRSWIKIVPLPRHKT